MIAIPVNSFENYPMSWKPDRKELRYPIYYCLADMMERDIKSGRLPANTKMPPQRELADFLDLNLSTITKAYKLCEMRGLIHAVTGKGTFVVPSANVPMSTVEKNITSRIEMAVIHPFYQQNKLVRDLTLDLLNRPGSEHLFEYSHPLGSREQIQTAAGWVRQFGLDADEHNTLIASGAQNALATVLSSLFEAGDRIAVDTYTYPNFISLANQLYLQLAAVENDECGMRPDVLDTLCTNQKIKGIFLMPAGSNPTNIAFSDYRRKEIAAIIRRHSLIAIEDDNYAALMSRPYVPVALEAPEHCIYISGLSKPLCPGLRIAYLHLPKQYVDVMEQGIYSQSLKISSLNIEIATELIRSGLFRQIIAEKRAAAVRRNQIYHSYFPSACTSMESYYQWLKLPLSCSGKSCEAALSARGVSVFGAERFSVGNQAGHNAIRIATCSPKSHKQPCQGLDIIRAFLKETPSS